MFHLLFQSPGVYTRVGRKLILKLKKKVFWKDHFLRENKQTLIFFLFIEYPQWIVKNSDGADWCEI